MYAHEDDFLPFLPSITGEDGTGATSGGLMTRPQFSTYCATIRDTGAWGGEPEIQALARAYKVPIFVVQAEKPHIVPHMPSSSVTAEMSDTGVVRISYHRRMYGLGEVRVLQPSCVMRSHPCSTTIHCGPRLAKCTERSTRSRLHSHETLCKTAVLLIY